MAAYNLATELDRQKFRARTQALLDKEAVVSLEERTCRSLNQNAYLHLLIGTVAMEVGTTLEDAKTEYFKKLCNRELFEVRFRDPLLKVERTALRSTASLTKEEMSTAIDRFKHWGNMNGIYMPEPGDASLLAQIRCEMEKQRNYL
jgi:hypothetical protein